MGQARIKQRAAFPGHLVDAWEAEVCVNFAVALARISGWLLHVDWWTPSMSPDEEVPGEELRPLRVYVADNGDRVFDVRGVRGIVDFTERTVKPLAVRHGNGGIRTRFYSEDNLVALPLPIKASEAKIAEATAAIRANAAFSSSVPTRGQPCLPAHEAARFTFGQCVPFAEALRRRTGLQTAAILAKRFKPHMAATQRGQSGFVHSVVLHPDGMAEDSWGKASLTSIADRFGVTEFELSHEEHLAVAAKLQMNTPARYQAALSDAMALLQQHRPSAPALTE